MKIEVLRGRLITVIGVKGSPDHEDFMIEDLGQKARITSMDQRDGKTWHEVGTAFWDEAGVKIDLEGWVDTTQPEVQLLIYLKPETFGMVVSEVLTIVAKRKKNDTED